MQQDYWIGTHPFALFVSQQQQPLLVSPQIVTHAPDRACEKESSN